MRSSNNLLDFPLYHGSSTLHAEHFAIGAAPTPWPHKDAAISLLEKTWGALADFGHQPEWWQQRAIDQVSGPTNWRHGFLYASPSRSSAMRYARSGSDYGGELLSLCHQAVSLLATGDPELAQELLKGTPLIAGFLNGGGAPILVEIGRVRIGDLLPERDGDDIAQELELLGPNEEMRELFGQQSNFVIKPGCGSVTALYRI